MGRAAAEGLAAFALVFTGCGAIITNTPAAQLAGATAAAFVLTGAGSEKPASLGATVPSVGVATALLYEVLLRAFRVFVIIAARA